MKYTSLWRILCCIILITGLFSAGLPAAPAQASAPRMAGVGVTVRLEDGSAHLGMPLYGQVNAAAAGQTATRYFTDFVTGEAALNLELGTAYTLTASAEGYLTATQTVTYSEPGTVTTITLKPTLNPTCPAGYQATGLTVDEGFESGVLPPAGWTQYNLGAVNRGFYQMAINGDKGAYHNYNDSNGTFGDYNDWLVTPSIHVPDNGILRFYQQESYPSYYVYHGIWVTTGTNPSPSVSTYTEFMKLPAGPNNVIELKTLDLSAYAGQDIHLAFVYKGKDADAWWLDDIAVAACASQEGGRVAGYVTDAVTGQPMVGAGITTDSGLYRSFTTPDDPQANDGLYIAFAPIGENVVTASKFKYTPSANAITAAAGSVTRQDFALAAVRLAADSSTLEVTIPQGEAPVTIPVVLSNTGLITGDYTAVEVNQGAVVAQAPAPSMPDQGGLKSPGPQAAPGALLALQNTAAPGPAPLSTDKAVINSWPTGLTDTWGIGYDQTTDDLWISSIANPNGDSKDHRFTTSGQNTGDVIDTLGWGDIALDITYNPWTGMLWQMNYGTDKCVYELDPVSKAATGTKICPTFPGDQYGLVYDPNSKTFYSSNAELNTITHFDEAGNILSTVNVGVSAAGLAFNPFNGHLLLANYEATGADIVVLDTNNNYALLDSFSITGVTGYKQSLEMDCSGSLWLLTDNVVYQTEPVESGSICGGDDIPWLSLDKTGGSIAPDGSETLSLTYDAADLAVGKYIGAIKIKVETPYAAPLIKVILNVTPPNQAPVVDGVESKTIPELERYTFTALASDVDLPAQKLRFSLVDPAASGAALDPDTGVFTWTPAEDQGKAGGQPFDFTVKVSDGYTSTEKSFSLMVDEVNSAPVFGPLGDQTVTVPDPLTFTLQVTDSDVPAQPLTYGVKGLAGLPGAVFDQKTLTFTWTPTYHQAGDYVLIFTVKDGLTTTEKTIIITVDHGYLISLPDIAK